MRSICSPKERGGVSQGRRTILLLLFFVFSVKISLAQPLSYDQIQNSYFFDFLTFKSFKENKTFLEIFCQFPFKNLKFINSSAGLKANYRLDITIANNDRVEIYTSSHSDSIQVGSYQEAQNVTSYSEIIRFTFVVSPGDYEARISISDNGNFTFKGFTRKLHIPDYTKKGLNASDIQAATSITATDKESILVKNGREIRPNVSHTYGPEARVLYIYNEVYNLYYKKRNRYNAFQTTYTIFDHNDREVKKFNRQQDKPGRSCAFSLGIPIVDLDTGRYKLVMEITDLDNSEKATKEILFNIIKDSSGRKIVI